jgi:hypothetical protein
VRQNPNKRPIGRQPFLSKVAPSKPNPWYGTIEHGEVVHEASAPIAITGGSRFTVEQLHAMAVAGIKPDTAEVMQVRRQACKSNELFVPLGELPPVFAFDCPVLDLHGEKVRVIAPSGQRKLVAQDGWALRPQLVARNMWGEPV